MLNCLQLNNSNTKVWNGYNYHIHSSATSCEKYNIYGQTIFKKYQSKNDMLYKSSSFDFYDHMNSSIDSPLDLSKDSTLFNGKKMFENVDKAHVLKPENKLEFGGNTHEFDHYPIDLSKPTTNRRKVYKKKFDSISNEIPKHRARRSIIHCDYCPYVTNHKNDFRKHMHGMHLEASNVVCPKCGITSKHKYSLKVHLSYCGKEPRFLCAYCPYKSRKRHHLQKHVLRHVNNTLGVMQKASVLSSLPISLPCTQNSNTQSKVAIKQTLEEQPKFNRNVTPKVSALPISHCNQNIDLLPNQKIEQKNVENKSKNSLKECPGCGKVYKHWGLMQRHYKSCSGNWIQCKYCPYKAKDSTMLEKHVFSAHINSSYEQIQIPSTKIKNV